MGSVNKHIILGNLGQDPKLHRFDSGNVVCNLSVATNERYKNRNGEMVDKTTWHDVKVWGKQAEACEKWLNKGDPVYIEGKIDKRQYTDDEGNTRYAVETVALPFGVTFVRAPSNQKRQRRDEGGGKSGDLGGTDPFTDGGFSDDDIPF